MALHLRAAQTPPAGPEPAPAAVGKHDAYVAAQLRRAERRIRNLDMGAALLGFLALTCGFVGAAALADYLWPTFAVVRPFVLVAFLLIAAGYLGFALVRPLLRNVNPYYTARHMERTTPGAKNSVVNWLDLHETTLPAAIRNSLGQRAAKDLARADVEKAFSGQRTAWAGGLAGAFIGLLIVQLFWFGPGDFFFHVRRSFAPVGAVVTRTTLTVVQPAGGTSLVTAGKPVRIAVDVGGQVPDANSANALTLHYRYDENDPYLTKWLEPDATGQWSYSFSAFDVKDGFLYKVTGGDTETPEYQIKVQSSPLVKDVEATYQYRAYTGKVEELHQWAKPVRIEVLRGTTVTLVIHTNRTLKDASLELESKDGPERIAGQIAARDARTFLVTFVADHSANYRVHFVSTDNEANVDNNPHPLVVLPDNPPNPVELTLPGKNTELQCNGLLQLEGRALDDYGVKSLTLQMQVVNGPALEGQKYRSGADFALPGGGYPRELSYKDAIDLAKVKGAKGEAVQLQPGMELEYWLEARDACDYPQPDLNKTDSQHFRVKLLPPETDEAKRQQERDQAKQEQQQHDQKQQDALKKEAQERADANKKTAEQNKENKQPKPENSGEQGNQSGAAKQEQAKKDQEKIDKAQQLKKEADANKREGKSESKPDPKETGEAKNDGAKGENAKDQRQPADAKPEPKPGGQKEAGDAKGAGEQQPGKPPEPSSSDKPDAAGTPMDQKGQTKNDPAPQPNDARGEAKEQGPAPQPQQQPDRADTKSGGKPDGKQPTGESKPDKGDPKQAGDKSAAKPEGAKGNEADKQPAAEAKEKPPAEDKADGKPEGSNKASGADSKSAPKEGAKKDPNDKSNEGSAKPDEAKPENKDQARGDGKGDPKDGDKPGGKSGKGTGDAADAKQKDVDEFAKALQGDDPGKRQDAADALEEIQEEARDPKVRQQAADALKKTQTKPTHFRPAQAKQPPNPADGAAAAGKQDDELRQFEPAKVKPTEGDLVDAKRADAKDEGKKEKTEPTPNGGQSQPTLAQSKDNKGGKGQPGGGNPTKSDIANNQPEPPPLNEKGDNTRAGALTLEDVRKALTKDKLKEMDWTDEDKERYLKELADAMKRQQATKTPVAAPQNTGSLPNLGGGQATSGDHRDNSSSTKPLPPPEYRNPYANFRKDLGQTDKK